ncbi:hypothetical protein D1007_62142 [Hordeum vulgare]|nr:hypothetical protein D1007_62142 [Hordeum vulgare]
MISILAQVLPRLHQRGPSSPRPLATAKKATTADQGKDKAKGKAAKKVFSLTGQKFETPEEREPLGIFYESLSKQTPSSEMAQFWLWCHLRTLVRTSFKADTTGSALELKVEDESEP